MSDDNPLQPTHLEAFAHQLQSADGVEDAISAVAERFGDDLFDALHDFAMSEMQERSIDRFDSGHMIGHIGASICVLELPPHGAVVFGLVNRDGVIETEMISWHLDAADARAAADASNWWPPGWE